MPSNSETQNFCEQTFCLLFTVVAIFARHAMRPINLCKLEAGLVVLIKNMLFLSCRVDEKCHSCVYVMYIRKLFWVSLGSCF